VSAYPNPFNPETTIRYTLPAAGRVHVDVFDATGSHVRALVNREQMAGAFTATWDGRDQTGRASASGIYFARIQHNGATRAYKLVMLK
jgi:flagellar hook assembly protein FlgD